MRLMKLGYPTIKTFSSKLEYDSYKRIDELIDKAKKLKQENPNIKFNEICVLLGF